jgi:hypothetical protein
MADVKVPDAKIAVLDPAAVTPVIGTPYPAPCATPYSLVDHGKQNGRVSLVPRPFAAGGPASCRGHAHLLPSPPAPQRGT